MKKTITDILIKIKCTIVSKKDRRPGKEESKIHYSIPHANPTVRFANILYERFKRIRCFNFQHLHDDLIPMTTLSKGIRINVVFNFEIRMLFNTIIRKTRYGLLI